VEKMACHAQHTRISINSSRNPAGTPEQDAKGLLLQIHLSGQFAMLACTLTLHTSSRANMSAAIALEGHRAVTAADSVVWLSAGRV